jgi:hypothetical protein
MLYRRFILSVLFIHLIFYIRFEVTIRDRGRKDFRWARGCGQKNWRAIDLKSSLNLNKLSESLVRYNLLLNNNKMSTPPRRQASKHWETPTHAQVLTLLEEGYSQRQISCRISVPQELQDRTIIVTFCDVTIFTPAAQKSLPKTIFVV